MPLLDDPRGFLFPFSSKERELQSGKRDRYDRPTKKLNYRTNKRLINLSEIALCPYRKPIQYIRLVSAVAYQQNRDESNLVPVNSNMEGGLTADRELSRKHVPRTEF